MDYDAWLVDLDGTLYHALPVKAAMAVELVLGGLPAVGTLRAFRRQHEELREHLATGADPYRAQLERTASKVGRDVGSVTATVTEWMHARPGKWIRLFRRKALLDEIRAFRARGGKVALVSDYPARKKVEALGTADLFDAIVASGEPGGPGQLKPDPESYLLAAKALGVEPSRCLVIGDREDADGAAARAAGMAFRNVKG